MAAKDFLVSRIVDEASRRHVALSELEQKMLYFSERYPTLPDMMEVAEKFEAEYDDGGYEKKIKRLSSKAFQRDKRESPENVQLWRGAIRVLKREDHYILVMLDVPRSAADTLKLIVAALIAVAVLAGTIAVFRRAGQHFRIPDSIRLFVFVFLIALAYYLAYSRKGAKVSSALGNLVERAARWF